jgi:hypothetical protein
VLVALAVALFNAEFGITRTVLICGISSWVASFGTYFFLRPRPAAPPVFEIHNSNAPEPNRIP